MFRPDAAVAGAQGGGSSDRSCAKLRAFVQIRIVERPQPGNASPNWISATICLPLVSGLKTIAVATEQEAMMSVVTVAFARIGAVVTLRVEDYYPSDFST